LWCGIPALMSRMISNDQRSPSISKSIQGHLTGADLTFPHIFILTYHLYFASYMLHTLLQMAFPINEPRILPGTPSKKSAGHVDSACVHSTYK
jgi:hypothetical protein